MIQKIFLHDFRNFSDREISFLDGKNIIIADNGKWKSNILEALSLAYNPMVESDPEYLTQKWKPGFFIRYTQSNWELSISYEKEGKKKKYMIGKKSTVKKKVSENYPHIISFHPIKMNLMYLWPTQRRDFLDEILSQTFPEYKKILLWYKKVLRGRNAILKRISEWKSQEPELSFWDEKYILWSLLIYEYKTKLIEHFKDNIQQLERYFFWKVEKVEFRYISKTDLTHAEKYLRKYIKDNREKEILLRKTLRGPHLDDFDIYLDGIPLIHFASRWEVKSSLLGMMFLETEFITKHWKQKDVLFIIDDILSELDTKHQDILWKYIWNRQSIITSIDDVSFDAHKIYL